MEGDEETEFVAAMAFKTGGRSNWLVEGVAAVANRLALVDAVVGVEPRPRLGPVVLLLEVLVGAPLSVGIRRRATPGKSPCSACADASLVILPPSSSGMVNLEIVFLELTGE